MANQEHVELLRQGKDTWNSWRAEHQDVAITLGMYVETDPETLRGMMDDLNDLFGGD